MVGLRTRIIKKLGLVVVILCLGFVVQQLTRLDLEKILIDDWLVLLRTIVLGGIAFGIINLTLSAVWQKLMRWSGEPRATVKLCHAIYARAQIAKYLPGNIFSIAGRHILGRQNGLSDGALFWAAALEILGMTFAAGLTYALAGIYWSRLGILIEAPIALCAVLAPLLLPWFMKTILSRFSKLKAYGLPAKSLRDYLHLYLIFTLYLPWLAGAAGLLWWITLELTGTAPGFIIVLGISSGAWLAGYIVPGASGGIGVREALLILALKPLVGDSIVIITIVFRMITLLGDVIYFVLGLPFSLDPVNVRGAKADVAPATTNTS